MSSSEFENLSDLSTTHLGLLFRDACNDLHSLKQLNEELKKRKSDHATDLQIAVVTRIYELLRQNRANQASSPANWRSRSSAVAHQHADQASERGVALFQCSRWAHAAEPLSRGRDGYRH
jgi:hypothetical protein